MSIDVKEVRDGVVDTEKAFANVATGAILSAVDAASNPIATARKTARRLEKRGEPVNRRLERRAERTGERAVEATVDVVSGNLAERLTLAGIRLAKARARRRDPIGDVVFRAMELVHRGLKNYVDEVQKFQTATEPPTRNGEHRASPARRSSARRTTRAAARTTRTRRSTARSSQRTTARKSA
jgi:hypothetical protein